MGLCGFVAALATSFRVSLAGETVCVLVGACDRACDQHITGSRKYWHNHRSCTNNKEPWSMHIVRRCVVQKTGEVAPSVKDWDILPYVCIIM